MGFIRERRGAEREPKPSERWRALHGIPQDEKTRWIRGVGDAIFQDSNLSQSDVALLLDDQEAELERLYRRKADRETAAKTLLRLRRSSLVHEGRMHEAKSRKGDKEQVERIADLAANGSWSDALAHYGENWRETSIEPSTDDWVYFERQMDHDPSSRERAWFRDAFRKHMKSYKAEREEWEQEHGDGMSERAAEGKARYWYSIWGKAPHGWGEAMGWAFGKTPREAAEAALADANQWSRGRLKLPAYMSLQLVPDYSDPQRDEPAKYFTFQVDENGDIRDWHLKASERAMLRERGHKRAREGDEPEPEEQWIDDEYSEAPWLAQHWYSGQGDPLYAIASAGFPQPESTVEWALRNAERSARQQHEHMTKKYGKRAYSKLIGIDPESSAVRKLPAEKREDLEATYEIDQLVYELEEVLKHGKRISATEGWRKHGR
jgi:hypothetical protein